MVNQASVTSFFIGRVPYRTAYNLQRNIVNAMKCVVTGSPHHCILLLEHTPVYTIGVRHTDPANDYSDSAVDLLKRSGADFVKTDRGGLITYHGPGQLVAYPIIDMRCNSLLGKGLRWYANSLAQAGVSLCSQLGLKAVAGSQLDLGVWLTPKHKVMAIGIHQSGPITYHGVAINCSKEPLTWLRQVTPCGLVGRDVISLSDVCQDRVDVATLVPQLSTCLIDSLFGPLAIRQDRVQTEYRSDLAQDWTGVEYTDDHIDENLFNKKRLWSDLVQTVLDNLQLTCFNDPTE